MTQNQTRISDNRADVDFTFVHGFLAHESIWATDIGAAEGTRRCLPALTEKSALLTYPLVNCGPHYFRVPLRGSTTYMCC